MRFQKLYFNEKENIPFEREKNEKHFKHNCYLNKSLQVFVISCGNPQVNRRLKSSVFYKTSHTLCAYGNDDLIKTTDDALTSPVLKVCKNYILMLRLFNLFFPVK